MTEQPPTYRIRSVADFAGVPVDRLGQCLEEFKVWLAMHHASGALLPGIPHANQIAEFTWIDDGKREASVIVMAGEREQFRHTFSMDDLGRG